jgi:hypothetical protein
MMFRKAICETISSLFVDVGDNVDILAEVEKCFSWDELSREHVGLEAVSLHRLTSPGNHR